jgi:hypothetical protein
LRRLLLLCVAGHGLPPARRQALCQGRRTHDLRARLRREVEKADVEELLRLANLPRGKKRLNDLLKNGYDDPAAACRRRDQE